MNNKNIRTIQLHPEEYAARLRQAQASPAGEPSRPFYGELTNENYSTAQERDYYEQRQALKIQAEQNADLDNLSAEQLEALHHRVTATAEKRAQEVREGAVAQRFLKLHPEFIPEARNGKMIQSWMEKTGLDTTSLEAVEHAYAELREQGVLQLDQNEIARQQARSEYDVVKKEYKAAHKANKYTDEELLNMTDEEFQAVGARQGYVSPTGTTW